MRKSTGKFVRVIIEGEPGKYLIMREIRPGIPESDIWNFPGGGVEAGENPDAAARRELKEEFDLDITEMKLVHRATCVFSFGPREGFFFQAAADLSQLRVMESKCVDYGCFSVPEMGRKNVSASVREVIESGLLKNCVAAPGRERGE